MDEVYASQGIKTGLLVLDFVTDIRRIAAVLDLEREAKSKPKPGEIETIVLRDGVVAFSNEKIQQFVEAWLSDVASIQDEDDAEKLTFPDSEVLV